jgi:hypothetical protein
MIYLRLFYYDNRQTEWHSGFEEEESENRARDHSTTLQTSSTLCFCGRSCCYSVLRFPCGCRATECPIHLSQTASIVIVLRNPFLLKQSQEGEPYLPFR